MTIESVLILIIVFLIMLSGIVINAFKSGRSFSKNRKAKDKSLLLFRLVVPVSLISSLFLYFLGAGNYNSPLILTLTGYSCVIAGLVIRWIAVVSLGKAFSVRISYFEHQTLKTEGIYRFVRHPSYSGLLMYYVGLGLVMHNFISLFILLFLPWIVVVFRIRLEEEFLLNHFTGYKNYQNMTWKIIPFIY